MTTPVTFAPKDDLDFDFTSAAPWFPHETDDPYVLVRVSDAHAKAWSAAIGLAVRRCYISDSLLNEQAQRQKASQKDVIAAALPDAPHIMSGDFGEILVYFYQGANEAPAEVFGAKKWRLKHERNQPAPKSDVVHFYLPSWPTPTDNDVVLCSEVKAKATAAKSSSIQNAIDDSVEKDQVGRLTETLVWLKERILTGAHLGDVEIPHLDRFLKATDHPPFSKRFRAVAVVCQSILDDELKHAPAAKPAGYTVVVIAVPDLKGTYSAVFEAARAAVAPGGSP